MKTTLTIHAVFYFCLAVYTVSLFVNALRKLRIYKFADYLLVGILSLFFIMMLIQGGYELDWWDFLPAGIYLRLPWYVLLLFSSLIFSLTAAVFRTENPGWIWLITSGLIIAIAVISDLIGIFPTQMVGGDLSLQYPVSILSFVLLALGWGGFLILTGVQVLRTYRSADRTVVKQRAIYWTSALILFIGATVLLMIHNTIMSSLLLLFCTIILNYLVLTYRLPDLKVLTYQGVAYLLSGIIIVLVFALGFLIFETFFVGLDWYKPVYNGIFFALFSLIFFLQEEDQ